MSSLPADHGIVVGHDAQRAWLRTSEAHAFAFVGPSSVGRRAVATWWATWLNCRLRDAAPCGTCESCRLAAAGTHPDLLQKAPARTTKAGRASLKPTLRIDQLVVREQHGSDPEPVSRWLEMRPSFQVRVAIVDDAHLMTEAAGNAFLKLLEEPPSWARIVLIAPSSGALLPTLASRVVVVRFGSAPTNDLDPDGDHPASRTGQRGMLVRALADVDSERALDDLTNAYVASLEGSLHEALAAGEAWLKAWANAPEAGLRQRLLTRIRRDAPERYLIALDALDEAHEALSAYVSLDVLAAALTLRLRRG